MDNPPAQTVLPTHYARYLLVSVFVIAACGIFYELLIGTIATYFLGSSVLYFSLTIGFFLFFMGVGSYLSKYVEHHLLERFVAMEIAIGLIGGLSATILYYAFSLTAYAIIFFFLVIAAISTLIGLEIPLVLRLLERQQTLKNAAANILAFDYVGALVASIIFPLVLLPYLGIMRTGFLIGIINLSIAAVTITVVRAHLTRLRMLVTTLVLSMGVLITGFIFSFSLVSFFESASYQDEIIFTDQTPYQRIVVTKFRDDLRLYLNGNLQFSSIDEYRYHEALVHVPLTQIRHRERVAILGGGDGLAVRELLKYPDILSIVVIDIDPQMTRLAATHPLFTALNQRALSDPRVHVVNQDAFTFLDKTNERFDAIIIDLPDPNDHAIGKLYTKEFYRIVQQRLSEEGVVVTQATSPYFAREPFWIIHHTLQEAFPHVQAYSAYIPSFGQWGFHMARRYPINKNPALTTTTRFVTTSTLPAFFTFDNDTKEVGTEIHTLDLDVLVQAYEKSWKMFNEN